MTKLKNFFKYQLDMTYGELSDGARKASSNEEMIRTLLMICCTASSTRAIKTTFERVLGKPEKPVVIKRIHTRILYPNATRKLSEPNIAPEDPDDTPPPQDDRVVLSSQDAPSHSLRHVLDTIGDNSAEYREKILLSKRHHKVGEVMMANLYRMAVDEGDVGAIELLLDYLDGAVADVVTVQTDDTILVENYSEEAPHNAIQGEDGIYYVDAS